MFGKPAHLKLAIDKAMFVQKQRVVQGLLEVLKEGIAAPQH